MAPPWTNGPMPGPWPASGPVWAARRKHGGHGGLDRPACREPGRGPVLRQAGGKYVKRQNAQPRPPAIDAPHCAVVG